MSVQIRYGVPFVAGIAWTINQVVDSVPVTDRFGNQGQANVPNEPNVKFTIINYDGDEPLGEEVYSFEGEDYTAMLEHIESVLDEWAAAFEEIREEFAITKTQPPTVAKVGLPFPMRLDRWVINLNPDATASVTALIGVYASDKFEPESLRSYKAVTAIDGKAMRNRAANRSTMVASIKTAEDIVNGVNKLEDRLPQDRERIKAQAANELTSFTHQLANFDKQSKSLCPLANLLNKPSVQQSVGLLCATLFTTLVNTDPRWANIDVVELMKPETFKIPDVS